MGKKERYRNHLPICNELGNKGGRTWWTGTYSSDSIAGEMYLSISVFWEETYTYKKAPRIWSRTKQRERLMRCIIYSHQWLRTTLAFVVMGAFLYTYTSVGLSALYQRCTLKDDNSYLLPTWLSAGTRKHKRKHHFIGWQERTNKMKNKSCATNFATQQPFSLLLLLQEPFLLAERKKMCYLSMAANQSQYTNINSFILGYIY